MCREVFGRGDSFVQKITGSPNVDRPLQRIREFRNRPHPGIVVTVDMLSTGVDIPALEFIVFLRPVKSRILFEQMLGRGTRRCIDINKSHFTVFDCFDGSLLEYFRQASAFTVEPPEKPHRTIAEVIDGIWQNRDRAYNIRCLVKRLQRIDKEISGEGRLEFAAFIAGGDIAKFAKELPYKLANDFTNTMVKHSARDTEPLLTAVERVDRALIKLRAGKKFTDEQNAWLGRIREHLTANLSIEREDFDLLPVFAREGGWGRANRAFDGSLSELIVALNAAMAA